MADDVMQSDLVKAALSAAQGITAEEAIAAFVEGVARQEPVKIVVIPYGVPDTPEAKVEAVRTGNCIHTRIHGRRPDPFLPLGMQIHFHENGDVSWRHWDGKEEKENG